MARWEPDAVGRMQQAAAELFEERGYENTTVAEIAERAGLTKRTFFRYFPDKREVLFWGSEDLQELVASAVLTAPEAAGAMEAAGDGLRTAGALFDEIGERAWRRHRIVGASPELQERELVKLAALGDAVAASLRQRAVDDTTATLTAHLAVTVFRVAFDRWATGASGRSLIDTIDTTLRDLRALTAG